MAKAVLPSPEIVKKCLVYMDLAIKVQMILFDLSSTVWWSTIAELFTFFYCFWVFMIDAERMGFVWMFMPHILRAIMGLALVKKLPTTHDMIASVDKIKAPERIPFSRIDKFVITGAKQSLDKF